MEDRLREESQIGSLLSNGIPPDFPRPVMLGSITGAQPKILLIEEGGKFYTQGMTPSDLKDRFEICDDLVNQLALKSLESKAGKRSHLNEAEILLQFRTRLIAKKWTSIEEAYWIADSVAKRIGWKLIGDEIG